MAFKLLYPAQPFASFVDEPFQAEHHLMQHNGLGACVFSFERLLDGTLTRIAGLEPGDLTVYRGWMLTLSEYSRLEQVLQAQGCRLLTSAEQYAHTHHLPRWYPLLKEHTPRTWFFQDAAEARAALAAGPFQTLFVKDWVKSLSTGHGPIAHTLDDLQTIEQDMLKYRGSIEGGLCLREHEDWIQATEQRCFVAAGQGFSRTGAVPVLVQLAAQQIDSPFFSVDVIEREDGVQRIVELGDGQVSDLKAWTPERFLPVVQRLQQWAAT